MRRSRERIKAELIAEAEVVIDALLDQAEEWEAPTLSEIEDKVLELRKRLSERMAEVVVGEQEAKQPALDQVCPDCGEKMRIVSFIEREQKEVIEKILRHCGLWIERQQRGPPNRKRVLVEMDSL